MSKANVKVITIEADNKADAMRQLVEQLGGEVPSEVLDALKEQFGDESKATKAAHISPSDTLEFVMSLRGLKPQERGEKLREHIAALGAQYGIAREDALKRADKVRDELNLVLEGFGISGASFGEPDKAQPAAAKAEDDDAIPPSMQRLREAGMSDKTICHIGMFASTQDELVESLQFAFHLADDHKHVPSAKLFQTLDSYITSSNRWVYDQFDKAGIDPKDYGFKTREEYFERDTALDRIRTRVGKVLEQ